MAKSVKKGPKRKRGKRNLISTLLVALILYIGIHFLARTDGVRQLVTDKVSNWTQLPVLIKSCRVTPLLSIRLEELQFPGVLMPEVRITLNAFALFSKSTPWIEKVDVRGLDVKLTKIPDSDLWQPLVLHRVGSQLGSVVGISTGDLAENQSLPHFPERVLNQKTIFLLERAKMTWRDEEGDELAYISGADSSVKVVAFSDRKAVQTQVTCAHIKMASGKIMRDLELETVKIDGYDPVLILKLTDSGGEYDGFQTKALWQDLSVRLDALSRIE